MQTPNLDLIKSIYTTCYRKRLNIVLAKGVDPGTLDSFGTNNINAMATALRERFGEDPVYVGELVVAGKDTMYLYNGCVIVTTPPAILAFHLAQKAVKENANITSDALKKAAPITEKILKKFKNGYRKRMNIRVWIDESEEKDFDEYGINSISSLILAVYEKTKAVPKVVGDAVAVLEDKIFVYRDDIQSSVTLAMLAVLRGLRDAGAITTSNAEKIARTLQRLIDEYAPIFRENYDCSDVCGSNDP